MEFVKTGRLGGRAGLAPSSSMVMIATVAVVAQATSADFITADWEADNCGVGVWTNVCWGAEPMPNNGNQGHSYHAIISDGIAEVTLNLDITLDRLSVFWLNTMIQDNGRDLNIVGGSLDGSTQGFIGVDGLLHMQSTGSNTDLTVTAGPFGSALIIDSVVEPGVLRMSNHLQNRIYGATGAETIKFGTDLSAGGSGQIGVNLTTLINEGTIFADQSTELRIDPNAGGMTNSGLMVARDGGVLVLNAAAYDNALGEIRAEDASTVRFRTNAVVTGGLMVAESGGLLEFNGGTLVGPTVRIDPGGVGQVTATSTVDNLTNDGVVTQGNSRDLHTSGHYINTSEHFLDSTGSDTDLIFDADTVLDGGGTINMTSWLQNRIYGVSGAQTFTNVDNTIRGSGQIGVNLTTIINEGTIVAEPGAELRIDPNAGGMTNSGLMVARDGGVLVLNAAAYDNALGEIRAEDASTVRFRTNAVVTGGLMVAESGGVLEFNGGTLEGPTVRIDPGGVGQVTAASTVDNLTNDGVVTQGNSRDLHTSGHYINTSEHFLDSTGSDTDLIFDADTVLDGGGTINMTSWLQNRIYGVSGAQTFTNVDNTIRGSGQIGVNLTTIINEGTIIAEPGAELRIDPNAGGMTNSGLMVARDGGVLVLNAAAYDNALGEIRAEDASTVRFATSAVVTGGLMVAESGGVLEFNGGTLVGPTVRIDSGGVGQVTAASTVDNLTNDGVVTQGNSRDLHTSGHYINTSEHFLDSTGSDTDLIFDADTVLDGGGTINMSNFLQNRIYGVSGAQTFTNVDNTIRGSGQIGVNLTTIINEGTIIAEPGAELRIDPNAGGLTNSGTLRAENGAGMRLNAGPFTTSGSVFVATDSTITRAATDYVQTGGSTIIDGSLVLNAGGVVTLDGGLLGGDGLVSAHVDNVAGTASPGSSAGTLTVAADYTQGVDGVFAAEIGGTMQGQFDVLVVNGNAALDGTLAVTFIDDFEPQIGQTFTVMTAADISGEFDIDSCAGIGVTYNAQSVVLTITTACVSCVWDIDMDLNVGFNDLVQLLSAWGPCKGECPADFDDSGTVDFNDLVALLSNWGSCP